MNAYDAVRARPGSWIIRRGATGRVPGRITGRFTRRVTRRALAAGLATVLLGGGLPVILAGTQAAAADPCASPVTNKVACENTRPGSPRSEWDVVDGGDAAIEGFTTEFSVNLGETVHFKIKTSGTYTMDIYRLGHYQGMGARRVDSVTPVPREQPDDCITQPETGLVDCGNWLESARWTVPSDLVSGVYFALLARTEDPTQRNHVVFVVRDDSSHSDLLVQTSDTTWQAYNSWGGNSLYGGQPAGRAYKVSYNRPFRSRSVGTNGRDFLFGAEYPMIRFLERNGYDVSYFSGIDSDRYGPLIRSHKVFVSSGHDEYWSGQQRGNVEAARDAGVHLAFFSGNEMLWKTRWEESADGTGTPYRTLVSYKETHANAKIDPAPVATGTWRDPRFGPDGGKPENGLTGTIWQVNCCSYAMKVPAADGAMRLWRDTSIANLEPGTTATLSSETLGYEWDGDLDNGARPRGLVRMSTTTENVPELVQGFGSTVAPGTATHHLTLYKAASGALVFGAGTVQWAWGLDDDHDGSSVPVDTRMQQATVNLLADMHVQPDTLMDGIVPATASSDMQAPQSNVTSPLPGAQLAGGSMVTITGTASDLGGGHVGGVEVSTDGGSTWHPATGRENWTYRWAPTGQRAVTIKTRAADDSGNVESPDVGITVDVSCPCSVFGATVPPGGSADDPSPLELGMKFRSATDGWVTGVRFYKGAGNSGTHKGSLWTAGGTLLATATFADETETGWQSVEFPAPVRITAGTTYVASYFAPAGHYFGTTYQFRSEGVESPPLTALQDGVDGPNGVYHAGGSAFPTSTFNATNYWVDLIFDTQAPPDRTKPAVTGTAPLDGGSSVPASTRPAVTFSEDVEPSSPRIVVEDQAGNAVAGAVGYDTATRAATFTPSAALTAGTRYTVTVSGAADLATPTPNVMDPYTYGFTTARAAPPTGVCPCSIWTDGTQPATASVDDPNEVELGVKFRADQDGFVEGIRFYKGPNNTGTHIGTLWGRDGTELAAATFTGESTTGWQEVRFSSRVAVTAGTTYVASYHTTAGWYSITGNGLGSAVVNGPLTALRHGDDGPNGVFRYGARGYPDQGLGTNYYVDVVFTLPPDLTPPQVTSTNPAGGATSIPVGSKVSATFDESLAETGAFTVADAVGAPVAGSASYDPGKRTLTFTPSSPLAVGTTFTATVSGAADASGNSMTTPYSWSFRTSGPAACPCTIFPSDAIPAVASAGDTAGVELGVKFTADVNGYVGGVRFYKGPDNTGIHTAHLWRSDGTLLATASFAIESSTGWQTATFPSPVAVTAGEVYVASYYAPTGGYAVSSGFFAEAGFDNMPLHALSDAAAAGNGVFRYGGSFPNQTHNATNYWVDPIFSASQPADTTPPSVTSTTPVHGQTSVPPSAGPTATFDEPVQAQTVQFTVTGPGGGPVAGQVSYDAASATAQFSPGAALAYSTTYTARVAEAQDVAGNTMAAAHTWSFTTAAQPSSGECPCSVWPDSASPSVPASSDDRAVEVGTKFRTDVDGFVTAVRFYKGAGNTGGHVGHLWQTDGTLLGTVVFAGESAAGWQEASFASPVAVTAGTTYVVSYHAPNGRYAINLNGLANAGVDTPPLHALRSGVDAPNGVYQYGAGGFPASGSDHNYWVDVVFTEPAPVDGTPPTVQSTSPADQQAGVPPGVKPSATFSEPMQGSTVQMTLAAGATSVSGTVSYDADTRTATFTPAGPLAYSTAHTVRVTGGRDTAGNPIGTTSTWTFTTVPPPDTTPPKVQSTSPAGAATQVATNVAPTATFSEPVQGSTVQMTLTRAGGTAVAGTVSYNAATRVAKFSPAAALATNTVHTAKVSGAKDAAGNAMATAFSWSFTTACPCTIWPATARPAVPASTSSRRIETGVKFRADRAGYVTGLRFYKGTTNTGTHVGRLWRANGTQLGSVTFRNETASGWQQAMFATPIAIAANTTYVASYWVPTGHYAYTGRGLAAAVDRPPLHALRSGASGPNGVYRYDSSGFPTSGVTHNYWVDVVFTLTRPPAPAASPTPKAVVSGQAAAGAPTTPAAPTAPATPATPGTPTITANRRTGRRPRRKD